MSSSARERMPSACPRGRRWPAVAPGTPSSTSPGYRGRRTPHGDDATAAARRWLPTVTVDPADLLFGTHGPVPQGCEVDAQVRNRRPAAQWTRLAAGRCDDLVAAGRN